MKILNSSEYFLLMHILSKLTSLCKLSIKCSAEETLGSFDSISTIDSFSSTIFIIYLVYSYEMCLYLNLSGISEYNFIKISHNIIIFNLGNGSTSERKTPVEYLSFPLCFIYFCQSKTLSSTGSFSFAKIFFIVNFKFLCF